MISKITDIKSKIERKATLFETGGFRPQNDSSESWIGKVYLFGKEEEIPKDKNGNEMISLAQLCLEKLPFVPTILSNSKIITIFISKEFPQVFDKMGDYWLIREYKKDALIKIKSLHSIHSHLKPFPLNPKLVNDDCPIWDGGGLDEETEDEILDLENEGVIDDYYDFTEHYYHTKIGGYPSFMQSGIGNGEGFGKGFEYVFQISSDSKANFNVVNSGSMMFAKNKETEEWSIYYDFC